MILSVTHPDIDPELVVLTGGLPIWLEGIKPFIDSSSNIEVGYMRLIGDDSNLKALTKALRSSLPGCRILRVIRPLGASDDSCAR